MRAYAALWLVLPLSAVASTQARATEPPRPSAPSAEVVGPATAGGRASVVIVSRAGEHEGLATLLDELLRRQAVASEFSRAARFDPDALFLETTGEPRVLVFVVVESRSARLYFRGPAGQRFLLRKLVLSNGLDAVGKELVGHVVESATLALLRSTEGLSREQASAELTREAKADSSESADARRTAALRTSKEPERVRIVPAAPPTHASPTSLFELALGARYGTFWSGSALALSHGPGAELGAAYRTDDIWIVRARVLGEHHFTRTLASPELEARVRFTPLRGGVDLGVALRPAHRFFFGAAAGADLVDIVPGPSFASDIELGSPTSRPVPALRFELRYEWVFGHVALAAAGFVDASLVEIRYELAEFGARRTLATPLPTRPGAALAVTFSPSDWLNP